MARFCMYCGHAVKEEYAFCMKCGKKIEHNPDLDSDAPALEVSEDERVALALAEEIRAAQNILCSYGLPDCKAALGHLRAAVVLGGREEIKPLAELVKLYQQILALGEAHGYEMPIRTSYIQASMPHSGSVQHIQTSGQNFSHVAGAGGTVAAGAAAATLLSPQQASAQGQAPVTQPPAPPAPPATNAPSTAVAESGAGSGPTLSEQIERYDIAREIKSFLNNDSSRNSTEEGSQSASDMSDGAALVDAASGTTDTAADLADAGESVEAGSGLLDALSEFL